MNKFSKATSYNLIKKLQAKFNLASNVALNKEAITVADSTATCIEEEASPITATLYDFSLM